MLTKKNNDNNYEYLLEEYNLDLNDSNIILLEDADCNEILKVTDDKLSQIVGVNYRDNLRFYRRLHYI